MIKKCTTYFFVAIVVIFLLPKNVLTQVGGVYEFVSQEITITHSVGKLLDAPVTKTISAPEWTGMWHFGKGYFSSLVMKEKRHVPFDCKSDMEFESFAGKYELRGETIHFSQDYSFNPLFKGRPVSMSFETDGKMLVLSREIFPTLEDQRQGKEILKLKRL